mmetsp:Transcript_16491/g.47433  ORF Transcript_16491/g.47433 Transcript_16491/m.47433 type:complete len:258 (-) Transcript_16491:317-1090(-)
MDKIFSDRRSRVRSITVLPACLVLAVSSSASASDSMESVPRRALAETFRRYDYDVGELEDEECRDDMAHALCPSIEEEHIPCSGLDAVEKFCRRILGEELVQGSDGEGEGRNAFEGCKNYVSWDDDRLNCCPSDHCFEVTGENEWTEWELVDEDMEELDEDDEFEYEFADVLYLKDGHFVADFENDEDGDFDDEDGDDFDDDEDEVGEDIYQREAKEHYDETRGAGEDDPQQADDGTRGLDDSLQKIPFFHVPPATT